MKKNMPLGKKPLGKKLTMVLAVMFATIAMHAQNSHSLASINDENISWRVLEKAESAYDEHNFSRAAFLAQNAKINRQNECKIYVEILEEALRPLPVQQVGDEIDKVLEILVDRHSNEAIKIINDTIYSKGTAYFDNSIKNMLDYYHSYYIYPEADFLLAKIYRLEGEFELSQKFYMQAWENSDKLDIKLTKYDILYELASLYKIRNDMDNYEKTLLLIVADDPNFYQDGKISPFLSSVIQNAKRGTDLNKLFLLYRSDSYNQINAYFQLAQIYYQAEIYDKMLEVSMIGMLSAVTRIEQILSERELEYSYKNFSNFYKMIGKQSDIINWGVENDIWRGFYEFAICLEKNNLVPIAKEMHKVNSQYSPEDYWKMKSKEELKRF